MPASWSFKDKTMRTILLTNKEIRAALRRRGIKVYGVSGNLSTYEIAHSKTKQGRILVQPAYDSEYTSDHITIYSEI
jgi:hypothetical protein